MNRTDSLKRLLGSLTRAEYAGDVVDLRVEVDVGPAGLDGDTIDYLDSFEWPHGTKLVNVRNANVGLAASWIDHAWPDPREGAAPVVVFEDDITVSPAFWRWIRHNHAAYAARRDVAGLSLQRPTTRATDGHNLKQIGPENQPFLYKLVGSIGFSPRAAVWREFRAWYHDAKKSGLHPFVDGLAPSKWYRDLEKQGRARTMWTQWFICFTKERGLYTLYQNPDRFLSLATHWREPGGHTPPGRGPDFAECGEEDVAFPRQSAGIMPRYSWDGEREDVLSLMAFPAGDQPAPVRRRSAAAWPRHSIMLNRLRRDEDWAVGSARRTGPRLAVLLSGLTSRLVMHTTFRNVISPSAEAGIPVDVFVRLSSSRSASWSGEEHGGKEAGAGEPWLRDIPADALGAKLCGLARGAGASVCRAEVGESERLPEPPAAGRHRNRLWQFSFFNCSASDRACAAGNNLLRRWTSLQDLWRQATTEEADRHMNYTQILVVRDDSFWAAPFRVDPEEFIGTRGLTDRMTMINMDCLKWGGINDKVFYLGRGAADHMLRPLEAWLHDDSPELDGTMNSERFLASLAAARNVSLVDSNRFPMALMQFEKNGLPCFRKTGQANTKCWNDERLTDTFHAMSCEGPLVGRLGAMASPSDGSAIHAAVRDVAGKSQGHGMLVMATRKTTDLAENLLCGLEALGAEGQALVVALEGGLCGKLPAGRACVEVLLPGPPGGSPGTPVDLGRKKLLAAAVALHSGFAESLLVTDGDVVFLRDPRETGGAGTPGADVAFQSTSALRDGAKSCADLQEGGREQEVDLNFGVYRLQRTSGGLMFALRALQEALADESGAGGDDSDRGGLVMRADRLDSYSTTVGRWPCNVSANGNVFWGHPEVVPAGGPAAVRASWMADEGTKRACLEQAGLWRLLPRESGDTGGGARCQKGQRAAQAVAGRGLQLGARGSAQADASGQIVRC